MSKEKNSSAWSFEQKRFLLKQLIRRDFKSRYKRAFFGILWSMMSPLFIFGAQAIVFTYFLGRSEHYISYLIIGNIVFHYFTDSTGHEMHALNANSGILSKIKINKEYFLWSKSLSCLVNFFITMIAMFIIVAIDHVPFHFSFILLIFPITCLFFFNLGVGYILSALYVFFKDTEYLYRIFTRMLIYFSAIFYRIERFPESVRMYFFCNPVYCYIHYFRSIIMYNTIPDFKLHILCIVYPILFIIIGKIVYNVNNSRFIYYF